MKVKKKQAEGYMSIEAAVIVPLTIFLFAAIIYVGMFLYNHVYCMQNCYIAALRGSQQKGMTEKALQNYVEQTIEDLLDGKLLNASNQQAEVSIGLTQIKVSNHTTIRSAILQLRMYQAEEFDSQVSGEAKRLNPTEYIRLCHKVK